MSDSLCNQVLDSRSEYGSLWAAPSRGLPPRELTVSVSHVTEGVSADCLPPNVSITGWAQCAIDILCQKKRVQHALRKMERSSPPEVKYVSSVGFPEIAANAYREGSVGGFRQQQQVFGAEQQQGCVLHRDEFEKSAALPGAVRSHLDGSHRKGLDVTSARPIHSVFEASAGNGAVGLPFTTRISRRKADRFTLVTRVRILRER